MKQNYDMMIEEKVLRVFSEMEKRVSTEDMARIHEAYEYYTMTETVIACSWPLLRIRENSVI